jgi:large subunit ribosomal protein L22
MEVVAKLFSLRMAPRKVRLVADLVRRLPVLEAERQLVFLNKAAAMPLLKLIRSAIANAEHNFKLSKETLWISHLTVDGGTTIKRFRPRAHGSAAPIRKRTSHITVKLSDGARPPAKAKRVYRPRQKVAAETKAAQRPVNQA